MFEKPTAADITDRKEADESGECDARLAADPQPHDKQGCERNFRYSFGEPRPRAGAKHERRLLGVGSSAWFGVQGDNRVQRAALLPSGCFSLYASYFPVE